MRSVREVGRTRVATTVAVEAYHGSLAVPVSGAAADPGRAGPWAVGP
jgi:hypothetical protein